jgi:AcrR family transcriptional regulator
MSTMAVSDATPLRADARRNLELILEAARAAFAERGLDVGVEEIARRAGVGKATFFRRFPSKDALILAVLEGFLADVEASAERAVALDDPWDGLRLFLAENARMQADNVAFFDAMAARYDSGAFPAQLTDRGVAAAEKVLRPARKAGVVRKGVKAGDLTAMLKMLGAAVRPMPGVQHAERVWMRYLELLLSGIRAGQDPLPGIAMDPCALAVEACRRGA